ncbi:hypothetical protein N7522_009873 [Penicillium canescens]|nr:hypothetical protein N7522_009873 [Penicillium canescens]
MAYEIHPERIVPALKDKDLGTACLQYLAHRFNAHGERSGRTADEKGAVFTWVAYQTVGIE